MTNENLSQPKNGKRLFYFVIGAVLVCLALTSLYMPRVIEWYFNPPQPMGISCTESIHWALHRLQVSQLISIGVGMVIGLILGLRFRKRA